LYDKARYDASVIRMGSWSISVEDARNFDRQTVLPPIVEEERFGAALSLVLARPRPDWIDVAPIVLRLWVHRRIAVNLAGRSLKDLDLEPLGQPKHVGRTDDARLGGLHRILLVVNRGCRTGEIENLVDLHEEGMGDVVAKELDALVIEQMLYVASCASEEVVDTEHLTTAFKQAVAQMGPEKSGTSRYKNPPFEMHPSLDQIKRSPQQDLRAGFRPAGLATVAAQSGVLPPRLAQNRAVK
jgi:hypothetical protein